MTALPLRKSLGLGGLCFSLLLDTGFAAAGKVKLGAGEKADDFLRRHVLVGKDIPADIFALRQKLLKQEGGVLHSHLVANGGHDNPERRGVMFMCFETFSAKNLDEDELFLGFFLGLDGDTLAVLPGFIELIAWDRTKKRYNFWEVIDDTWFYRGDSRDILDDAAKINLGGDPPVFAAKPKLRCSGCHTMGGPIMKETAAPHNDWWTRKHGLNLGPWKQAVAPAKVKHSLDPKELATVLFRDAADASHLSAQVRKGIDRLLAARAGMDWDGQTLKQQLRSLFSSMEMNLVSDAAPFAERVASGQAVEMPVDFFVDARLQPKGKPIAVPLKDYQASLKKNGFQFAKGQVESRHALLVPARSYIDSHMIDILLEKKMLDEDLVMAVLGVDLTTPLFSKPRTGLLKYVPDQAKDAKELRAALLANLDKVIKESKENLVPEGELRGNLQNAADVRARAAGYLKTLADAKAVDDWLEIASQRRLELVAADISKHPQGNILEEGFRRTFPASNFKSVPGRLRLDEKTGRIAGR